VRRAGNCKPGDRESAPGDRESAPGDRELALFNRQCLRIMNCFLRTIGIVECPKTVAGAGALPLFHGGLNSVK
jgi:hypothetical protein